MKFRTDFVTNSSSSSFITITVTKKDDSTIVSELETSGNICENHIAFCKDLSSIVGPQTQDGKHLLQVIQAMYNDTRIDYLLENEPQPLATITDFQNEVKNISIKEEISGDIVECFDSILTAFDEEEVCPYSLEVEMSYDVKKKEYSEKNAIDEDGQKLILWKYEEEG